MDHNPSYIAVFSATVFAHPEEAAVWVTASSHWYSASCRSLTIVHSVLLLVQKHVFGTYHVQASLLLALSVLSFINVSKYRKII